MSCVEHAIENIPRGTKYFHELSIKIYLAQISLSWGGGVMKKIVFMKIYTPGYISHLSKD